MLADTELSLADFDYDLPSALIAQHPLSDRSASRLLHVTRGALHDLRFTDLEALLPGDLVVFNDTQVLNARLIGSKPSGGRVEALIERVLDPLNALALVRTSHSPKPGSMLYFGGATATVAARQDDLFVLTFSEPVLPLLQRAGQVPLPPYIVHTPGPDDAQRYQTIYATRPGAVAAPTAGLHFTQQLLDRLREKNVQFASLTLHVGAGTFQPVRTERISEHRMHREWLDIPSATAAQVNAARRSGQRVVAVGTTSLRALESAVDPDGELAAGARETALFITPGYQFRIVDRLLTNFHLPRSTLLMLVAAFAGLQTIRRAYAHAVEQRYRFFSYGDAMLLERAT